MFGRRRINKYLEKQIKSKKRVANHGEVFTAEREVKAMCDLVKQETERIESRFLEPACGNGNFLVEILGRKLKHCSSKEDVKIACSSIYGIDILEDNVLECRARLQELVSQYFPVDCSEIFSKNIVQGDFMKPSTIWFLQDEGLEDIDLYNRKKRK